MSTWKALEAKARARGLKVKADKGFVIISDSTRVSIMRSPDGRIEELGWWVETDSTVAQADRLLFGYDYCTNGLHKRLTGGKQYTKDGRVFQGSVISSEMAWERTQHVFLWLKPRAGMDGYGWPTRKTRVLSRGVGR